MRRSLRRGAVPLALAAAVVSVASVALTASPAGASTPPPSDDPTTTTTTTTLPPPPDPLDIVVPGAPARRLENDFQATPTLPPPPRPDALPENSGEGRRVVYSKSKQRLWTVEEDGTVSRTYLVSGRRTWNQPPPNNFANTFEPQARYYADPPAYYRVFSRSAYTCNITKPHICWRYMVRFTKGPDGDNIGFHEIPKDTRTGRLLQTEAELGAALSNGCVRQAAPDAEYMWNWAPVGTKVVVLP